MTKAYFTDSFRSIKRTFSRFISIIAIVAMGSGFFFGLNSAGPDMIATADKYYTKYNLMDLKLQSFLGLYDTDLEKIRKIEGVESVQGAKFVDGFVQVHNDKKEYEGIVDIDGSELTVRVMGVDINKAVEFQNGGDNPDYINRLNLIEGRYPESENECVVTNSALSTPEQFQIGKTIKVVGDKEEIRYALKNNEFKIVGIVQTPLFVSYERGVTTAGSGKLGDFVYVNNDAFAKTMNHYSEAYVTIKGADSYSAYSKDYEEFIEPYRVRIVEESEKFAQESRRNLIVGLPQKLMGLKQQIDKADLLVGPQLTDGKKKIQELYELEKTGAKKLKDAQKKLDEEYKKVQGELQSGSNEYMNAVNEYNKNITAVSNSQMELSNKKALYNSNRLKADEARKQLDDANIQLTLAEKEIKYTEGLVTSTKATLNNLKQNQDVSTEQLHLDQIADRLEETNPELAGILKSASNLTAQGMAADAIVEVEQLLTQYEGELAVAKEQYKTGKAQYDIKNAECTQAEIQLQQSKAQLDAADAQLKQAERDLKKYEDQIKANGDKLQYGSIEAQTKYMTAQATLALQMTQYQNIKETIAMAEREYASQEDKVSANLGVAKTAYQKGLDLINNIRDNIGWDVYTRKDIPGFTGYGQAAKNMVHVAIVFPTFFFIVSTMICLTTMTRMVEEERTQLGTLKALGYSNKDISKKYLIYASLASVLGVLIGIGLGFSLLPLAIDKAWSIMYVMPKLSLRVSPVYLVFGILIAIGTTVLAALLACRKELQSVPAVLMRPKPPKAGKRVWLEKVTFIWSRLSFTGKVTLRNLFRNKKRFFVTILGIAGCTALLLSAFGLRDAVSGVIDNQYNKETGIAKYDLQVVLKEGQKNQNDSSIVEEINRQKNIQKSMLTYLKVCTGFSSRTDKELEVDILVPENPKLIKEFVNINDGGKDVPFNDNGAVITKKLADKTNTKVGDFLTVSWTQGAKTVKYDVKVIGIADNYTFHYVYMTPEYYENLTGEKLSYNYLFCKLVDDISNDAKIQLEKSINDIKGVNGSVFTTVIIDNFNNIVNTLNMVIAILIIAAMALAIVVLYNLNNINVNERIRELATLKVLGFYNGEVSAYIYRENVILTAIGILLGMLLGIPLNVAVVGVVDIDTLTFKTTLEPLSFLLAVVITIVFAIIVNVAMHYKLKKISMVESLKSVE